MKMNQLSVMTFFQEYYKSVCVIMTNCTHCGCKTELITWQN